ncbi:hypothetical protein L1987_64393 [Smallanthus sonchifolius]|uniref:Uncharacterized protein n=1 Tax=Smallanthus sonchifolius TaxID=185202 RepID=A0ACB9CG70_9ASTR|nr:hypothetical protein L1987_64393 [Smallanthus sonchifolius]
MSIFWSHFVPNLTIGAPVIESLRKHTKAYLDCHLMVTNPLDYVDQFGKAGAMGFTFHVEPGFGKQKFMPDMMNKFVSAQRGFHSTGAKRMGEHDGHHHSQLARIEIAGLRSELECNVYKMKIEKLNRALGLVTAFTPWVFGSLFVST